MIGCIFSFSFRVSLKSITFGKRLTEVRKDKKMSQDEVGKLVGVHGAVIGRYEREEVKPSIEVATQLAEALEISLDYLVGATDVLLEKNIVAKILDIQKLKENDRQHVFALLDAFLKQTKLQSIM
nr:helix-turn-helix transcriptional regulator [Chryseobacterium lathyri]